MPITIRTNVSMYAPGRSLSLRCLRITKYPRSMAIIIQPLRSKIFMVSQLLLVDLTYWTILLSNKTYCKFEFLNLSVDTCILLMTENLWYHERGIL